MNTQCECSEEYGPCEEHCEVIAQRAGASSRTADDLAYVFLCDVLDIVEDGGHAPTVTASGLASLRDAVIYWEDDSRWDDNYGCRWVKEDEDSIHDDIVWGEQVATDLGLSVYWEDGYVISRVTGGPLVD